MSKKNTLNFEIAKFFFHARSVRYLIPAILLVFSISFFLDSFVTNRIIVSRFAKLSQPAKGYRECSPDVSQLFQYTEKLEFNNSGEIQIISSDLRPEISLSKRYLPASNERRILIDGDVIHKSSPFPKYAYEERDSFNILKSIVIQRPSKHRLSLVQNGNDTIDLDFQIKYCFKPPMFPFVSELWFQVPKGWARLEAGGLMLSSPVKSLLNSIAFRRKFRSNVLLDFSFQPCGTPLNFSVFLSTGTSIMFGDGDSRTIRLKQTKKLPGDDRSEKIMADTIYSDGFKSGITYRCIIRRTDCVYTVHIAKLQGELVEVLNYQDPEPEKTIEEELKMIGFACWKDGQDIAIKSIIIQDMDKSEQMSVIM